MSFSVFTLVMCSVVPEELGQSTLWTGCIEHPDFTRTVVAQKRKSIFFPAAT